MLAIQREDLLLECIYRWEKERAGRIFLTQPHGGKVLTWTWAETVDQARRMACYLARQGWEPGSRVGILARNCAWWIMADFAVWLAGHASVPVYPSLKRESIRQILEHSGVKLCFVGAGEENHSLAGELPPGVHAVRFPTAPPGDAPDWDSLAAANEPLEGEIVRDSGDVATIIYTSGTTGAPKGVVHSFAALACDARCLSEVLKLGERDRALSYLPLAHILERAGLEATAVYTGLQVFFSEGVETFLADLRRARPTILLSVPRLLTKFQQGVFARTPQRRLNMLLRVPAVNRVVKRRILRALGLSDVRFAACGGAPLPPDLLLWYRGLGLELAEGYGMTEIMITHLGRLGQVRAGYVGPPIDAVEQKLAPDGELLIKSPTNMLRYHNDPDATREAFTPDGFFRTGDLAAIDPDGQVRIVGRAKEQFKTSKGKYVAPAPIENRLAAHPDVEACCLMGSGMPRPLAVVLLSADVRKRCADPQVRRSVEDSLAAVLEALNRELEAHERIAAIVVADGPWTIANGLLTPTLKVRRSVLELRYRQLVEKSGEQPGRVVWESGS